MISIDSESFLAVVVAAALAAFVAGLVSTRLPLPVVVVEIVLGICIGPEVLGLAHPDDFLDFFSSLGLGMLFFFAGYEIDFERIRGSPLRLAVLGWLLSLVLAYSLGGLLALTGLVLSLLFTGSALATTAIGTLIPVLSDAGELRTRFGTFLLAAGAMGEFGPILLITLVFSTKGAAANALILGAFVALAVIAAVVAVRGVGRGWELLDRTLETSGQLAIRIAVVTVFALGALAASLGLDLLLGGFVAGVIARIALTGREVEVLESKLTAVGYGFFIPFFFVVSGIKFDLAALTERSGAPARAAALPRSLPRRARRAGTGPLSRRARPSGSSQPGRVLRDGAAARGGDHHDRGRGGAYALRPPPLPSSAQASCRRPSCPSSACACEPVVQRSPIRVRRPSPEPVTLAQRRSSRSVMPRRRRAWKIKVMQLDVGSSVRCSDGDFGEISDVVIIDPTTRRVLMVVQPHHHQESALLVPAEWARASGPGNAADHAGSHDRGDRPARLVREAAYLRLGEFPVEDPDRDVGVQDILAMPYYQDLAASPATHLTTKATSRSATTASRRVRSSFAARARCTHPTGIIWDTSTASSSTTRNTSAHRARSAVISGRAGDRDPGRGDRRRKYPLAVLSLTKDEVGAIRAMRVHRWGA